MTREEANIKMKDKANRELWIMEVLGTSEKPRSTKYSHGMLYVLWHKNDFQAPSDMDWVEYYDTSNIYGECEDDIHIEKYKKMKPYTPYKKEVA